MIAAASTCLSLPVAHWPELDQARWRWALQSEGFLEVDKPASQWSPARRRIVEQAYGQWLAFLARQGALDPSQAPGQRATDVRLRAFIIGLQERVAPPSTAMMVEALLAMG